MTTTSTNVNIRIDKAVKSVADAMLADMGLTFSGAVNLFIRQMIKEREIPFRVKTDVPPYAKELRNSLSELKRGDFKAYACADDMFAELNAEVEAEESAN
ncbi:DNA-damage-inducible protein J [Clostridia bacterium]|nr:DNA-damage-inducible protein J [Clostridia bacterium]